MAGRQGVRLVAKPLGPLALLGTGTAAAAVHVRRLCSQQDRGVCGHGTHLHCPTNISSPVTVTDASDGSAAAELRAIVASFDRSKPVEEALTLPSAWYTHRCVWEAEQRSVFGRRWQFACHAHHVARPGQFCTVQAGGEPLIVVRDESGQLHCHFNVCRHHAAIVEGRDQGSAGHFRCPYHGFEYALDGRLRKATQLKGIKNFTAKSFGLVKAEVQEWGPFVFVRPVPAAQASPLPDADAPATFLQPLDGATRAELSRPRQQRFIQRRLYTMNCNWKVFVDNYLDGGFHVPHMHVDLSKGLALRTYRTQVFQRCSVQSVGSKAGAAAAAGGLSESGASVDERIGTADSFYCFVYPNLMMNRYGAWLDLNIVRPLGVDRCEVLFEYYLDEDVAAAKESSGQLDGFVRDCLQQSDVVQQEDIEIVESVQRGLRSVSYDTGRYAPSVEHAMHDFHCTLAGDLVESLQ